MPVAVSYTLKCDAPGCTRERSARTFMAPVALKNFVRDVFGSQDKRVPDGEWMIVRERAACSPACAAKLCSMGYSGFRAAAPAPAPKQAVFPAVLAMEDAKV